jgi:hypothetical protein
MHPQSINLQGMCYFRLAEETTRYEEKARLLNEAVFCLEVANGMEKPNHFLLGEVYMEMMELTNDYAQRDGLKREALGHYNAHLQKDPRNKVVKERIKDLIESF